MTLAALKVLSVAALLTVHLTNGATTTSSDGTCSNGLEGIEQSGACCVLECTRCGGAGCSTVGAPELDASDCCSSEIQSSGVLCSDSAAAPCIISQTGEGAVEGDANSTCSNGISGIESGGSCCVAACGACGGIGCASVAEPSLGASDCCATEIQDSGIFCNTTGEAPCIVYDFGGSATVTPAPVSVGNGTVDGDTGPTPSPASTTPAPTISPRGITGTSTSSTATDTTCSNGFPGIESRGACCVLACGQCGGAGCANANGLTSSECCVDSILDTAPLCAASGEAPCVLAEDSVTSSTNNVDGTPSPSAIAGTVSPAVNDTCSNGIVGIEEGGACCVLECGQCGGYQCTTAGGLGAPYCCVADIIQSNVLCNVSQAAPCIVNASLVDSASATPSPSDGGRGVPIGTPVPSSAGFGNNMCNNGIVGIQADEACCVSDCGQCGGAGCTSAGGLTGSQCCADEILVNGTSCAESGEAPCIVEEDSSTLSSGTDSPYEGSTGYSGATPAPSSTMKLTASPTVAPSTVETVAPTNTDSGTVSTGGSGGTSSSSPEEPLVSATACEELKSSIEAGESGTFELAGDITCDETITVADGQSVTLTSAADAPGGKYSISAGSPFMGGTSPTTSTASDGGAAGDSSLFVVENGGSLNATNVVFNTSSAASSSGSSAVGSTSDSMTGSVTDTSAATTPAPASTSAPATTDASTNDSPSTTSSASEDTRGGVRAIYAAGNVAVDSCEFVGSGDQETELVDQGGAIYMADPGDGTGGPSSVTCVNSSFEGTAASGRGGAIYAEGSGHLDIRDSSFSGNTAGASGGSGSNSTESTSSVTDSGTPGTSGSTSDGATGSTGEDSGSSTDSTTESGTATGGGTSGSGTDSATDTGTEGGASGGGSADGSSSTGSSAAEDGSSTTTNDTGEGAGSDGDDYASGGAIYTGPNVALSVSNTKFEGNAADDGGAIASYGGTLSGLTVSNTTTSKDGYGAVVSNVPAGNASARGLSVSDSAFVGNSGGALAAFNTDVNVTDSDFTGNNGAVYFETSDSDLGFNVGMQGVDFEGNEEAPASWGGDEMTSASATDGTVGSTDLVMTATVDGAPRSSADLTDVSCADSAECVMTVDDTSFDVTGNTTCGVCNEDGETIVITPTGTDDGMTTDDGGSGSDGGNAQGDDDNGDDAQGDDDGGRDTEVGGIDADDGDDVDPERVAFILGMTIIAILGCCLCFCCCVSLLKRIKGEKNPRTTIPIIIDRV